MALIIKAFCGQETKRIGIVILKEGCEVFGEHRYELAVCPGICVLFFCVDTMGRINAFCKAFMYSSVFFGQIVVVFIVREEVAQAGLYDRNGETFGSL